MQVRVLFAILILGCSAVQSGTGPWTPAEEEIFLARAAIQSLSKVAKGINGSAKAVLSDGRRTHEAHVQWVDIYQPLFKGKDGSEERDFRDSWKFNVAAYRLAKLLRLTDMVPVSVARLVDGKPASVDWWADDVIMDEKERLRRGLRPPDVPRWNDQMDTIRIFDQLIYNMDRSQENLLITSDWKVWMIDHTRAFRKWPTLRNADAVTHCSPGLLSSLRGLRRRDVAREAGAFLTAEEIDALMARRDLILQKLSR